MKIRIQGNSVRIRLSKKEVDLLTKTGTVIENTVFGTGAFSYAIQSKTGQKALSASFENSRITMFVPSDYLKNWATNNVTGFDETVLIDANTQLYLLLEKDFKCLDNATEDQSDHYENPKKSC